MVVILWGGNFHQRKAGRKSHLVMPCDRLCVSPCLVFFCRWFCHVDDDNYVNLHNLLHLLSAFSHSQDIYVGRPSLDHPIEAADHVRNDGSVSVFYNWASVISNWTNQILALAMYSSLKYPGSPPLLCYLQPGFPIPLQNATWEHFPNTYGAQEVFCSCLHSELDPFLGLIILSYTKLRWQ